MSKHTPGPWRVGGSDGWSASTDDIGQSCYQGIQDDFGDVVALAVAFDADPFSQPDTRANARLIAAAPDLLNALQLYIAHAPEPECAIWRDVQNRARAAIAKATGEAA